MVEKNNGGNETTDNVEKVKVGKHEVNLKIKGEGENAKYEVETPDGLNKEETKEFESESAKAISLFAKANKKGFDTNKRQEELDNREKELNRREAEIKVTSKEQLPDRQKLIMKELNVTDPDELEDFTRSEFLAAQEKADEKISKAKDKMADNKMLISEYISKGGDYNKLLNYANELNAPISKALINQFVKNNGTKPTFATQDLSNIQKSQISFVKKGGSSPSSRESTADNILKVGNESRGL